MLRVTNYGAATAVIEGRGIKILCDPWLSGHIYYGAWEREHTLVDPLTHIGPVNYIWISHLHDDHCHIPSLKAYIQAYPGTRVWIGNHCRHLKRLLIEAGILPLIADHLDDFYTNNYMIQWGADVIANTNPQGEGIDSALVVYDYDSAVVDLNDNQPDQAQADAINARTKGKHITALIPYTGAGPHPQAFEMPKHVMWREAEAKKAKFLAQFEWWKEAIHADVAVPFSAGYRLRGPLEVLNKYRGIPEPSEVPGATLLPVQGTGPRPDERFDGYDWEKDPMPTHEELNALLDQAIAKTPRLVGNPLSIRIMWETQEHSRNINITEEGDVMIHEEIIVDPRLLKGLLTKRFHFNTCEIGSCFKIKRFAKHYDQRVFQYLYRFRI